MLRQKLLIGRSRIGKCLIGLCLATGCFAQRSAANMDNVLEDIYNQLAEYDNIPWEEVQEDLTEIALQPINLNQTTEEELNRLHFLTAEQIDAILLYQYKHPFQSLYELQLIPELQDYDIRNLLPFVVVGEAARQEKLYFREVFRYARHELTLRTDARNCEDYTNDPFYAKFRYRFNYQNRVQAGLTIGRPTGSGWRNMQYGGYIQLRDMGWLKSMVVGDFQASFGQGLVVGSPLNFGKSSSITPMNSQEGIRKSTAIDPSFHTFHGVGATARVRWADISAFYSLQREKDSVWHHVVGADITARWKQLKVGITALENLYSDASSPPQMVVGLNARYNMGRLDIWGEIATTQGEKWGIGGIGGLRLTPVSGLELLALYRYYSADYNNLYAHSFSEKTKVNDENGFYLGMEVRRLRHWRFTTYIDGFQNGYDGLLQADFQPRQAYAMSWKIRVRRQTNRETYAFRYRFVYTLSQWTFRTQADMNYVLADSYKGNDYALLPNIGLGYGASVYQDVEYRVRRVPIVLQFRAQAFDARLWYNRIYAYENDVLYAAAFPYVYGVGGRLYANARYRINDIVSVYLRLSETIYHARWAADKSKKPTRTDVHLLVRIKL